MKTRKDNIHPFASSCAESAPDRYQAIEKMRKHLENLKECFRVSGLINSSLQLDEVLESVT